MSDNIGATGVGMAEPVLELRDLSLAFGGLTVFDAVSLSVARGELLALIGPNGAGKTSVLNCVSGIYQPRRGEVRLEARSLLGLAPHEVARAGVARTFQHGELFAHLSVTENLLIGRHSRINTTLWDELWFSRRAREADERHRERVEEIIEFVEIERLRDEPLGKLSFAQQKLIGFARALCLEPRVLLLDEPSAGLNREAKEDLARFILRIREELGTPMIWVEHDMQMVVDLADRIHALNYGQTLASGTPEQVLSDPAVVQAYLGTETPGLEPRARGATRDSRTS